MNKVQFITQAAAQQLNLSNVLKQLDMLKPTDMEAMLNSKCICCGGLAPYDAIWDVEVDESNGNVYTTPIGYTQDLFCEGCVDHIPASALLAYGVISQKEYDNLCNPFDDYTPMDSNDLLDPGYDCSPPTEYWEQPSVGGMFDCGDDELPF